MRVNFFAEFSEYMFQYNFKEFSKAHENISFPEILRWIFKFRGIQMTLEKQNYSQWVLVIEPIEMQYFNF